MAMTCFLFARSSQAAVVPNNANPRISIVSHRFCPHNSLGNPQAWLNPCSCGCVRNDLPRIRIWQGKRGGERGSRRAQQMLLLQILQRKNDKQNACCCYTGAVCVCAASVGETFRMSAAPGWKQAIDNNAAYYCCLDFTCFLCSFCCCLQALLCIYHHFGVSQETFEPLL